ncbi:MAG: alpha,2-mannosyltransferase [Frankiales bacterium]|nr:alpha,2-mannosyltransferase [Frankiales bacterium]
MIGTGRRWFRPTCAELWLVASLAILTTSVVLFDGRPLPGDRPLASLATHAWSRAAAEAFTQLGSGWVLYGLLLAVATLTAWRDREVPVWPLAAIAMLGVCQTLEGVLFVTVSRADARHLGTAGTFSSGHAASAVVGWGALALCAGQLWHRAVSSRQCLVAGSAAGLLVGTTRIALGVHWPSDVLAAVAFGALLLSLGLRLCALPPARWPRPASVSRAEPAWQWAVPGAVVAVLVALLLATPPGQRMKDLLVYQGTGGAAGAGADVYGFRTSFDMPFTYPPFAALLSEPLGRMSIGVGQALWLLITVAAAAMVTRGVLAPVVRRFGFPLTLAALLVSSPVRSHVRFGQVGLLLVAAVGADLLARPRRWSGAGLGVASAVKLTPLVFVPWMALTGQRGKLARTLVWFIGCSALGLLLLWRSAVDYVAGAATDSSRFGRNDIAGNQSMRGMLLRTHLSPHNAALLWLLAATVLAAISISVATRAHRSGHHLAAVGSLAALSVAVSPISWVHHLVWLSFGIAALCDAGRWRLAAAWWLLLLPGLPALADHPGHGVWGLALWVLLNAQGLSAVAAAVLLPRLCAPTAFDQGPVVHITTEPTAASTAETP